MTCRRPESSPAMEDPVPHFPQEQQPLRLLWETSQGYRQTGLPYRNIYIGAVSLILAGWVFWGMDSSFCSQLGGILMLAGGVIGAFYSLKSLRQDRLSAKRR